MDKAELGGLDSTSATINKWDTFFKKALPNLGYRDSLLDNMYPYKKGIPMKDGSYLPVDDVTGRRFFKMSWADKLSGILSKITTKNVMNTNGGVIQHGILHFGVILEFISKSYDVAKKVFPDITETEYDNLRNSFRESCTNASIDNERLHIFFNSDLCKRYWAKYLDDSDVYASALASNSGGGFNSLLNKDELEYLKDTYKFKWINRPDNHPDIAYEFVQGISLIVFNRNLDNVFDKFPGGDLFQSDFTRRCMPSGVYDSMNSMSEVYFQDYLVVSLNPIDKFMLSTKQAFSSCMSIAKQDDTRGTNSGPAFGLPALFPTDSVFLIFLTPGKHKNMYWEESEWIKSPSDRDKDKAYKYLKMTCRALTYKCKFDVRAEAVLRSYKRQNKDMAEVIDKMNIDGERLLVGRQYSARGEDYNWEWFIEFAMARAGIATGAGLGNDFDKLREVFKSTSSKLNTVDFSTELTKLTPSNRIVPSMTSHFKRLLDLQFMRCGRLCDGKCVVTDRYGYIRGIYYDNVQIDYLDDVARDKSNGVYQYNVEYPCDGECNLPTVKTGTTREGSYGITRYAPKTGLDMFKMIMGKQGYTFLQQYIKICSHCGKALTGNEIKRRMPNGDYICDDCCEKLGVKECPVCHELFTKEEADKHIVINFRKVTNPKNWEDFPEIPVCYSQLKKAEWQGPTVTGNFTAFCAHCGKQVSGGRYSYDTQSVKGKCTVEIPGKGSIDVTVVLCSDCLGKAVMCEKCKRIIFLDTIADACLLLPNRRVICPDCIKSIRMKQEKRSLIKKVLDNLRALDLKSEPSDDVDLATKIARDIEDKGMTVGRPYTLIKDVVKQITSYKQAHPEVANPTLAASNAPIEEDRDEVDDLLEEMAIPF